MCYSVISYYSFILIYFISMFIYIIIFIAREWILRLLSRQNSTSRLGAALEAGAKLEELAWSMVFL